MSPAFHYTTLKIEHTSEIEMLYLFEISHDTRIQSVVVVFGEPHVEEVVLVFDLGQSDGRQPGEDQWQQNEHNVMSAKKYLGVELPRPIGGIHINTS